LEPLALPGENSEVHLIATKDGRLLLRLRGDQRCSDFEHMMSQPEVTWIAERVPRPRNEEESLITCVHARPPSNLHHSLKLWGLPSFILLKSSETLAEFAERLRLALGANKGEFSSWKLARLEKETAEGVIAVENALAQVAVGSAWSFVNKGHEVIVLHHDTGRADSHMRAVKIQ